jgi:signal peptidase II
MRAFVLAVALLGVVGCDQATKRLAESALAEGGRVLLPGVVELQLHHNHGVAFNLERVVPEGARPPLALLAPLLVTAAVAVAWARRRRRAQRAEALAYAVVLGGALGNVVDRLGRGYVVDFIHVTHWPVFNVADVAVVAGALLLLVASRRQPGVQSRGEIGG